MRRLLSPIALCFALGACSMYNVPGRTPSAFDGSYAGTMTMLAAGSNGCPANATAAATLMVQNGMLVWNASPSTALYAPVGNDGAFAAQNGAIYLSGKITNRAMVARVNDSSCHKVYDLLKAA